MSCIHPMDCYGWDYAQNKRVCHACLTCGRTRQSTNSRSFCVTLGHELCPCEDFGDYCGGRTGWWL